MNQCKPWKPAKCTHKIQTLAHCITSTHNSVLRLTQYKLNAVKLNTHETRLATKTHLGVFQKRDSILNAIQRITKLRDCLHTERTHISLKIQQVT